MHPGGFTDVRPSDEKGDKMRRKKAGKRGVALCLLACLLIGGILPATEVQAVVGETVTGKKTGREIVYEIQAENMASGQDRSVLVTEVKDSITEAAGQVCIPAEAYIYDGWENTRVFEVTGIKAGAFSGCGHITKVYIEGAVTLPEGALDGLSEGVFFETGDLRAKKALLDYGIPDSRIAYQGTKSNYVAFGDSIAAGYALAEYASYGEDVNGLAVGDAFPTPAEAFPSLLAGVMENSAAWAPASLHNMAVSGTTSQQLLEQLERGDYDGALARADVVTVTIGSNDLLGPFIDIIKQILINSGIRDTFEKDRITIRDIKNIINGIPGLIDSLNVTLSNNQTLIAACNEFKNNIQPRILAKLKELAPNAQIYWTTLYNPFYGQELDLKVLFPGLVALASDPSAFHPLPLGELAAPYIEMMNQAFEANSGGYTSVDLYDTFNQQGMTNVDIRNEGDDLYLNLDPHPNARGHQAIEKLLEEAALTSGSYQPEDPPADQSGEMEFLSFHAGGIKGSINETEKRIVLELPQGTDVTRLVPEFAISAKAKAYIGEVLQSSGVTANDFTSPVVYTVESEIGARKNYQVEVRLAPPSVTDPGNTGTPDSGQGSAIKETTKNSTVETGDGAPITKYVMLLAASALLAAGIGYKVKRKKRG